jgi:predicted DNA-binding ribbon-helix-helix protein
MRIHGRATSVKLERAFWAVLEKVAHARGQPLSILIADIQRDLPPGASLASWLRVFAISQDWLLAGKDGDRGQLIASGEADFRN